MTKEVIPREGNLRERNLHPLHKIYFACHVYNEHVSLRRKNWINFSILAAPKQDGNDRLILCIDAYFMTVHTIRFEAVLSESPLFFLYHIFYIKQLSRDHKWLKDRNKCTERDRLNPNKSSNQYYVHGEFTIWWIK